ncbi:MAG: FixH family protein [Deltaproteobacteria bacterium]|nr:FixH family protein [Deltaproteobacteria bacterium]
MTLLRPALWLAALVGPLLASACADDPARTEPTPEPELVSLGLSETATLSVELLAEAPLAVGLNQVYYRLRSLPSGALVTRATVTQVPIMHMAAMDKEHSCPCEQPPAVANDDGLYPAFIVFQMASGMSGDAWRNEVTIELPDGGDPIEVTFAELAVAASSARKDLTLTDAMGGTSVAIVTLDFAAAPAVGHNPFTVTVHQKADMMGMVWSPLSDLVITATPDMPSMGHGSTGNEAPAHVAAGRYQGSVNLTMPGTWRIVLSFARGEQTLGAVEYTLDL